MAYSANAQVISGSIVIFNFTKDKSVVAADSLAGNEDTGIPDYSDCKIAAFGQHLIFTTVGNSGWSDRLGNVPAWDNIALARDAFQTVHASGGGSDLNAIAAQWASDVKSHWDFIDRMDRQRARSIAASNDGQFTAGMFIGKGLSSKVVIIGYDFDKPIDPIEILTGDRKAMSNCWSCGQLQESMICGAGKHLDVAANYCAKRQHGERIDVHTELNSATESTKLAVKIVEMTIDSYGQTAKDVGGKVDAVTIMKDGSITWNARKANCPDNQN
jgi:hypothetical protein